MDQAPAPQPLPETPETQLPSSTPSTSPTLVMWLRIVTAALLLLPAAVYVFVTLQGSLKPLNSAKPQTASILATAQISYPISYVSGGNIVVSNADGTNQRIVVKNMYPARYPSWDWSPDNKKIVSNDAKIVDITTGAETVIPEGRCHNWSPDGKKIIYGALRLNDSNVHAIFSISADGSGAKELTTPGSLCSGSNSLSNWLPDSTKFIYSDSTKIFLFDTTTSTRGVILDGSQHGINIILSSAVSKNGMRIVFDGRTGAPGPANVYVVNIDGTGFEQLTNFSAGSGGVQPIFTPDGGKIIFISDSDDHPGLFVYDLVSKKLTNLSSDSGVAYAPPSISRDGRYAAYTIWVYTGNASGILTKASEIVDLVTGASNKIADSYWPVWSK